jgi:NAD(P)H-dependent FMN reductase
MSVPKILVIPGSLRVGSHNGRLAALAAKQLTLAEADVTRISLEDYPLPLFDGSAIVNPPAAAVQLKRMLMAHQGVFITSPEYNASVPPMLKNAIDWVSRVRERGEDAHAPFRSRVFGIASASHGADGGLHGLMALRHILELGCGALVIPEQLAVPQAKDAFDEMDNLKDENLAAGLKTMARRLVELASVVAQESYRL